MNKTESQQEIKDLENKIEVLKNIEAEYDVCVYVLNVKAKSKDEAKEIVDNAIRIGGLNKYHPLITNIDLVE